MITNNNVVQKNRVALLSPTNNECSKWKSINNLEFAEAMTCSFGSEDLLELATLQAAFKRFIPIHADLHGEIPILGTQA